MTRPFLACDSETDPFLFDRVPFPFVWGCYDGSAFRYWWEKEDQFTRWLGAQDALAFAHNGGRFDWCYLTPHLNVPQTLSLIHGRLVRAQLGRAELRDSWTLCPTPLAAYRKDRFDYSLLERERRQDARDAILGYLESDCRYLYEVLDAFWTEHGRYPLTLPQASLRAFRRIQGVQIPTGTEAYDDRFRPWYFGGRCQAFKVGSWPQWRGEIVDIASAYPHAMSTLDHWWGYDATRSSHMPADDVLAQSLVHFVGRSRGCLPVRPERSHESLRYDDVEGTFHATGHEIIAGLETGTLRIDRVIRAFTPKHTMRFDGFVERYWRQKAEAAKDSPERYVAKITMNGLYGKWAQDPRRFSDWRLGTREEAAEHPGRVCELAPNFATEHPAKSRRYYNVATAASITGAVRAKLWRAICASDDVRYCDTDSLITRRANVPRGSGLGEWEREGVVAGGLHIAGRKLYAARLEHGKEKLASKGVKLSFEEIRSLARGGAVEWRNPAPTMGPLRETTFVTRVLGRKDR